MPTYRCQIWGHKCPSSAVTFGYCCTAAPCYSVVFAGGGVKGGQVLGKSDRFAAYPAADPVSPADLVATIYHALGIDSEIAVAAPSGQPVRLCLGTAIHPL